MKSRQPTMMALFCLVGLRVHFDRISSTKLLSNTMDRTPLVFLVAVVAVSLCYFPGSATTVSCIDPDLTGLNEICQGKKLLFGVNGTDLDECIIGTGGIDMIDGGGGDDIIIGLGGGDTLRGGDGDDTIYGGCGNDVIYGGKGEDQLHGEFGKDTIYGQSGADTILGGSGADNLLGGDGNDRIEGNQGDDTLYGNNGKDTLFGQQGNDILYGNQGEDILSGGPGTNTIFTGFGESIKQNPSGNDTVILEEIHALELKVAEAESTITGLQSQLDLTTSSIFGPDGAGLFISKADHFSACIPEYNNNEDYYGYPYGYGNGYNAGTGHGPTDSFGDYVVDIPPGTKASLCTINEFDVDGIPAAQNCGVYQDGSQWRGFSFHDSGSDCACTMHCIWFS